jgi:hypothetical protein
VDSISLVLNALASGAVQGAADGVSDSVKSAYAKLTQLVSTRVSGSKAAEMILAEHASDPKTWQAPLLKVLTDHGVAADQHIIEVAQELMALLDQMGTTQGKYQVDMARAQGVQLGGQNVQINSFNSSIPTPNCELLDDEGPCCFEAVSRCKTCRRKMCNNHRASGNLCSVCGENERQRRLEISLGIRPSDHPGVRRELRARDRIQEIARQLTSAGITPAPSSGSVSVGRGLADRFRRTQEESGSPPGWYIGEYGWEVPDQTPQSDRARTWKIARTYVTSDGRLMMEGGHLRGERGAYIPFKLAPYKTSADTFNGEFELWEEIVLKMSELARSQGVNVP